MASCSRNPRAAARQTSAPDPAKRADISVAGIAGKQHAGDPALEHDPGLDRLDRRPRACVRRASTDANPPSCSRCLMVGNTSTISPVPWASSAAWGVNQPWSTPSSPSTRGSCPAGIATRKKWVSKRVRTCAGVIQRENSTRSALSASSIPASSRSSRAAAVRRAPASTSPSGGTGDGDPPGVAVVNGPAREHPHATHEARLRCAPDQQHFERLLAAAQHDHGRRLAGRGGRAGVVLLARPRLAFDRQLAPRSPPVHALTLRHDGPVVFEP